MSPRKVGSLTEDQITELWSLFGPPPVLSTENQQAYDKLRAGYAACYKPSNILHVRWIREAVDNEWEISRFVRHHTVAIERYFRKALDNQAFQLRFKNQQNQQRADSIAQYRSDAVTELATLQARIEKTKSDIEGILKRQAVELDHNLALEGGADS